MPYMFDHQTGTYNFNQPLRIPGLQQPSMLPSNGLPQYRLSPDNSLFDLQGSYLGKLERDGRLRRDNW